MKGLTSRLDMAKEKLSELENRSKTLSRGSLVRKRKQNLEEEMEIGRLK